MMFHKVKSVSALPDFRLLVQFCAGTSREYDVTQLFDKFPAFLALKDDPALFALVGVDVGGYGVSWNDDLDLSCDELFYNSRPVSTPFDNLLAFGDATALWGLNESTLRKAIAYGKLRDGIDVQKFGKQWLITLDAMVREYGEPKQ